jgi:hypothetical protein
MPIEELEHQLRSAFAKAAAAYEHPELARQRLLKRNYRPGRHPKRLAAGTAAVAAASATAVALTIGSAPPALATVTSALTRTLAQSYHLTEQHSFYYITSGRITGRAHSICTTDADPVRHLEASSCSNSPRDREVGRYTYFYIPDPVGHPGKHWMRTLTGSVAVVHLRSINAVTEYTPQQMLSQIKKAYNVTVIGPVSGPGWTGTRYAFTSSTGGNIRFSGTVDVDGQGRARALVLTMRVTTQINVIVMTQVLMFSDFGARVMVTPPPADQTFSGPSFARVG